MWKRLLAMVAICALLAVGLVNYSNKTGIRTDGLYYEASGIRPDAQMLQVNGESVCAEEFFYWLDTTCAYLESYAGGALNFNAQVTEELTLGEYAKSDAANTVTLYALVRQMAAETGVTLTEEDLAALDAQHRQYVDYYGGEEGYALQLQLMGVSEELLRRTEEVPYLYNRMFRIYCDPASSLYPGDDALKTYGDENGYVTAQLFYFPTEGLDDAALAATKAKAEDYTAQLSAAADKQAVYADLAAKLGLTVSGDGLTFNAAESDASLHQVVAALAPGQVSSVIETPGGYYAALRLETNYAALAEDLFNIYLQERQDSAKVEYSDRYYASLDAGAFYTKLDELRMALAQSMLAQN